MNTPAHRRPIIGISCGEIHNRAETWSPVAYGQSQTYIQSIIAAGGTPILLPLTTDAALLSQLSVLLDGLCLAGGNDLSPTLYGQPLPGDTSDLSKLRDATEQLLLTQALAAQKPILGICRGMQLLNVQFGGTLHTDLPQSHSRLDHNASTKLKTLVDLQHTLTIAPDSQLARIIGDKPIGANAHHHQAVDTLGKGITATAWAADGVIEGIELTNYPFAVGIQAHPESLTQVEPRWGRFFSSFVTAARAVQA